MFIFLTRFGANGINHIIENETIKYLKYFLNINVNYFNFYSMYFAQNIN